MVSSINPGSAAALVAALSTARLSNYRRFFGAASDEEAVGLYAWNEDLGAALFKAFSLLEVVLRNQFHSGLSATYGANGYAGSRDWYLHLQLSKHSSKNVQELLSYRKRVRGQWVFMPRSPVPTPDDVVSNLTFGFWQHLLDVTHDTAGARVSWGHLLPSILPGHRQQQHTFWRQQANQDSLFARIDLLKDLRNRIAHHEPLWKLGPLQFESRERPSHPPRAIVLPAPATPGDAVSYLQLLYDRLLELLQWLSPAVHQSYVGSETDMRCRSILTLRSLEHYRQRRPVGKVDITAFGAPRAMRQLIRYATRQRQPLHLVQGANSMGHWICPSP